MSLVAGMPPKGMSRAAVLPRSPGAPITLRARAPTRRSRPALASPPGASSGDNGASAPTVEEVVPKTEASSTETTIETTFSEEALTGPELNYEEPSGLDRFWTNFRLSFALPWRRFKSGSALAFKLSGPIAEQPQSRFSSTDSLPAICDSLRKAAVDPRIVGLVVKIDPLACGWATVTEIRRHVEAFKASGKYTIAYLERAGEKEYFLASAFGEIYAPPTASLSLRGMSVSGSFLRGVLDKVGVEPEVRRIGAYKSAGDQLLRTDMSPEQREQLQAVLDDLYAGFVSGVAEARGKTRGDVEGLLDAGVYEMEQFLDGGWVDGLKYEDEINDMVKERTGGKPDELRCVGLKKYAKVGRSAFPTLQGGSKAIAVVRASGAIVAGGSGSGGSGGGGNITAPALIAQLRALKKNKRIAAVVLRVDSPGGDALASDLAWREIQKLSEEKPVIASMGNVAASGGYYLSMAARKVVAEELTLTGSIGVVTGKFSLAELYRKAGFSKETLSKGRYAQLLLESRPFSEDEAALFDASAQHAYESFRNKAAASRGMEVDAMQAVAQGRVWSGRRALEVGLVDALGGINRAIALAKEAAGIEKDEKVRLIEVSRASFSPLALVTGGGASAGAMAPLRAAASVALMAAGGVSPAAAVGAPALLEALAVGAAAEGLAGETALLQGLSSGSVMAQMPELAVDGVASRALISAGFGSSSITGSELFD